MNQWCVSIVAIGLAAAFSGPALAAEGGLNGWGRAYAEAAGRAAAERAESSARSEARAEARAEGRLEVGGQGQAAGRPIDRGPVSLFKHPGAFMEKPGVVQRVLAERPVGVDRPAVLERPVLVERPVLIRPERITGLLR